MNPVTDFLAFDDYGPETLMPILERAATLADHWQERRMPQALDGLRVALVREDGGWRNTTAFDLGIQAMGGTCVATPIGLQGKEVIGDLARYLDNWFDLIVIRTPDLERLRELAEAAKAPVVNARTRTNHRCETLGDLAFALRERGSLDGLRVAVVAPDDNILGSWIEAASVLPIEVVQIYHERWHARRYAGSKGFSIETEVRALEGADIVITDCWPKDAQRDDVLPYRMTASLLARLAPKAFFIPCPPVTRGEEVSADAMTAPNCRVIEAKAFLLHAQNALLEAIAAGMTRRQA